MSVLLYGVRVRPAFRFSEVPLGIDDSPIVYRHYPEIAYLATSYAQATAFCDRYLPIDGNPFAVNHWYLDANGMLRLSLSDPTWREYEESSYKTTFSTVELCERILQIALIPPDASLWHLGETWQVWWEQTVAGWDRVRVEQLRCYLELPPWRPNPLEASLIQMIGNEELQLCDVSEIPFETLMELARTFDVTLLALEEAKECFDISSAMFYWWENSVSKLPAEAREALWRLLCPYPWEIVEVPF